jgi:hypothetical protein
VNVHGPLNNRIRRFGIHHVEDRLNSLVAAGSKDGGSQDLVGLSIHHDLHKPLRLALLDGAANLRHLPPPNQRAAAALANFFLGQACTGERRIDVNSIGGNAVADFARVIIRKIRADYFSIVKGCVCKSALSVAIPQRPDARDARLQLVINDNIPAFIEANACVGEPEVIRIWTPPHRKQEM